MLLREILPLLPGVDRLVDLTAEEWAVTRHLNAPEELPHERLQPSAVAASALAPGDLLFAVVGPDRTEPDELAAALAALPTGGRALLVSTWPAADLPYHRLLEPLGAASLQVTDAIPVSQTSRHGLHVALIATRVTELLAPHSYLMDLDHRPAPASPDGLGTLLRMANEHLLGELVARPARRRLREQDLELAELRSQLAGLRVERDALRHQLAVAGRDDDQPGSG
jgi:hypothetical protein